MRDLLHRMTDRDPPVRRGGRRAVTLVLLALGTVSCAGSDEPSESPPEPPEPPVAVASGDAANEEPAAGAAPAPDKRAAPPSEAADEQPAAAPPPPEEPASSPPHDASPPPHDEVLAQALELRSKGRFQEAIELMHVHAREHGDTPELLIEAAQSFFALAKQGFAEGADKFFIKGALADADLRWKKATKEQPDLPGAALLHVRILRYSEDAAGAREALDAYLAKHDDDQEAHLERGDMAQLARDHELADRHFTRAAELDPTDGRARLNATVAKQWLRVSAGQLEDGYVLAAKLLPEEQRPLKLLAGLYPSKPDKQLAAFDRVLADREDAIWARIWKAYIIRSDGVTDAAGKRTTDPQKALAILREGLQIAPKHPSLHLQVAQTLVGMGEMQAAVPEYILAIQSAEPGAMGGASGELDALLNRARVDLDLELRLAAYDALVAANPGVGAFGNNAGLWFRDVGKDYELSLRYYLKSVEAEPDDQDFINDTALIYLFHLTDRREKSLPMFEKVLRLVDDDGQDPIRGYWDALENLCKYWFEEGEYERVVELADRRLEHTSYPSMMAMRWRAQAERKLGKR